MSYRAHVITCSDRAFSDVYEDRSGPVLRDALAELGFTVADPEIVPDDLPTIRASILAAAQSGCRIVFTTGGTGVGHRDFTVEATRPLLAFEVPGLMEEVRRKGTENTPLSLLSRGLAGVILADESGDRTQGESTLVINAPGSRGGARDTITVIGPLLTHLIEQLDGADHV